MLAQTDVSAQKFEVKSAKTSILGEPLLVKQPRVGLEVRSRPVPHQVDQMRGHDFLLGLAGVQSTTAPSSTPNPPAPGRDSGASFGIEAATGEVTGQDRRHLEDGVVEQARVGARRDAGRRVADQDAEPVGALFDIGQQRQRHPLDPDPGAVVGQAMT